MKTCANPGCSKPFTSPNTRQKVCSGACSDELERLEHRSAYAESNEADVEKAVKRCADALRDGVNGKELRRRFGDHVYRKARALTGPVGRRSIDWLGVPV
jgi:hypothetical protein